MGITDIIHHHVCMYVCDIMKYWWELWNGIACSNVTGYTSLLINIDAAASRPVVVVDEDLA